VVYCQNVEEFMGVFEVVKTFMEEDMIMFTDISVVPQRDRKIRKRKKPDEKV